MKVQWQRVSPTELIGTIPGSDVLVRIKPSNDGRFLVRGRYPVKKDRLPPTELDVTIVDTAVKARLCAENAMKRMLADSRFEFRKQREAIALVVGALDQIFPDAV